jgi:two-component system, cell cycle response regulator CtrA
VRVLVMETQTSRNISRLCDSRWMVLLGAEPDDDALSILRHETFDLVLVDVASMGEGGLSFIRRVRMAHYDTPLMALTGGRADDGVRALGLGADDAFAQPIDPDEFRARISAVIRRYKGYTGSLLQFGGLSLSMDTHEVRYCDRCLTLTGKEYSILELLILRKGRIVTKEMFFNHLYGGKDEPEAKVIDVFICKLRRKLNLVGADVVIATIWGQGHAVRDAGKHPQAGIPESPSDRLVA